MEAETNPPNGGEEKEDTPAQCNWARLVSCNLRHC
jgi:hypothetical protein